MCIAIHKPAGKILPRSTYENCFKSNKDGAGFAFAEGGVIQSFKGFFDFDEFYEAYKPHEHRECIVHFRIATAGRTDADNCHPWLVPKGHGGFTFAIIHNGILSYRSSDEKSDTGHFVDEILGVQLKRDPWFLDDRPGVFLTEKFLGIGNKFVVLRSDGKVYVLNREAGITDDGVWYSNATFRGYKFGGPWPDYDDEDLYSRYMTDGGRADTGRTVDSHPRHHYPYRPFTAPRLLEPPRDVVVRSKPNLLPHLSRSERKVFFRQASELFQGEGLTGVELVERMRDAFIDVNPDKADLPTPELDTEIIKSGFGSSLYV